jgi:hypothetical protein
VPNAAIALYRGPASHWWDRFRDACVCVWTFSRYSHAELVIDGVCYSSSPRDGGVRGKQIDLKSGRWDVYPVTIDVARAQRWYLEHYGQPYDWTGAARFALPFLKHRPQKWFCFESVAAAIGLPRPHRWAGRQMEQWARNQPAHRSVW